MSERRRHWDSAYTGREETDLSWFQQTAEPSLDLIRNHSSPGSSVVDIGAGASRLVDGLLECGYADITLVDISPVALERTRNRLGARAEQVSFADADVTDWTPHRTWEVWHDRAVFHFLTGDGDRKAYLSVLDLATEPGAVVVFGTFAPHGPERCSGLRVQRYSAQSLQECLGSRYGLLESMEHMHRTPAGREQAFTFAVFRKL